MQWERELALARQIAVRAGEVALEYLRNGVAAEDKADESPVTAADRACETLIVGAIQDAFPEDGILGEEGASKHPANGRLWIIDPIDGTRDYVRRNRLWANLIALESNGEPVVGVARFPALNETYYATKGGGAFRDGEPIAASPITEISRAVACVNGMQNSLKNPHHEKLLPFMGKFWAIRSLGGALDAMFVCAGHADFWIEPSAKPWDLAVLKLIAEEAGCVFFDYEGKNTIYGGNAIICTKALEAEAREFLGLPLR